MLQCWKVVQRTAKCYCVFFFLNPFWKISRARCVGFVVDLTRAVSLKCCATVTRRLKISLLTLLRYKSTTVDKWHRWNTLNCRGCIAALSEERLETHKQHMLYLHIRMPHTQLAKYTWSKTKQAEPVTVHWSGPVEGTWICRQLLQYELSITLLPVMNWSLFRLCAVYCSKYFQLADNGYFQLADNAATSFVFSRQPMFMWLQLFANVSMSEWIKKKRWTDSPEKVADGLYR